MTSKLYYSRDTKEFSTEYVSAEELERQQFEQRCWEMFLVLVPLLEKKELCYPVIVEEALIAVEAFEAKFEEEEKCGSRGL